jgi:hypothetical protein
MDQDSFLLRNKKGRESSRPFCNANGTKKPWSPKEVLHGFFSFTEKLSGGRTLPLGSSTTSYFSWRLSVASLSRNTFSRNFVDL